MDLFERLEAMDVELCFTDSAYGTRYYGTHPDTGKVVVVDETRDYGGESLDVYVSGDFFTDHAEALAALSTEGGPKLEERQETSRAFGQADDVKIGYNPASTMYEARTLWAGRLLFACSTVDEFSDWLDGSHSCYDRFRYVC